MIKFATSEFHCFCRDSVHCRASISLGFRDVVPNAREKHIESLLPFDQISVVINLERRKTVRVLPMPCLVHAMNVGDVRVGGESKPHLHVVRVIQRLLSSNPLNYGTAHQDLGRGYNVPAVVTPLAKPFFSWPDRPTRRRRSRRGKSRSREMQRVPINHPDGRIPTHHRNRPSQRTRSQKVVSVEPYQKLSANTRKPIIERLDRPEVLRMRKNLHAPFTLGKGDCHRQTLVSRRVIDNNDFHYDSRL